MNLKITTYFTLLCSVALCPSCKREEHEAKPATSEVLIQVGDSVLTRDKVTALIPAGLSPADSLRMFDAIVEAWVDRNMLVNLAGSQLPDIEKIDHMVEQYRTQLLANEYRRVMAQDHAPSVPLTEITDYYNKNIDQFKLERPLVKGIYLKTTADDEHIDELRGWIRNADSDDIDNLENFGLSSAMEYDYFGDTWVDWQSIADHIPYRFEDADRFVSTTPFFEWEHNGALYMLRILDHLSTGSKMPLEYAEAEISERLLEQRRGDFDRELLNGLYRGAVKTKDIKPGAYTPLKYR